MTFAAYPNINEIMRVPGLLFWNPTNLSAEATWGTKLGYTDTGVTLEPVGDFLPIKREEYGNRTEDVFYAGNSPQLVCVLQSWNTTAIERCFPGMGGTLTVSSPGAYRPGKMISRSNTAPLLFVPDDTTNNPCLLLQKACPRQANGIKIRFSHTDRIFLSIVFHALTKSNSYSDGQYYVGPLSGAVLR